MSVRREGVREGGCGKSGAFGLCGLQCLQPHTDPASHSCEQEKSIMRQ